MAKRRLTEKTQHQRPTSSKPLQQERRQAARNDERAQRSVETASPRTVAVSYSRQDVLSLAALGLLVVVCYLPAMLWGGFVWDDNIYIKVNPVREVSGLWQIWFSPSAIEGEGHYWPLVYTTFWLEHKLWGFDPTGYHIVNVLLHLANTLLLWHLMRRLSVSGAWVVAAVFAVHPLHVESVAWIIERKDVLSGLFYLAAVLTWMRFVEQPSRGRYAGALALYVGGMLSKSIVVTLPATLLIWHWWKQGRAASTDLLRLVPFFVVGLVITVGDLSFARFVNPVSLDYSLAERTLIAARALWFYAGKLLWPSELAVIYPLWDIRVADLMAWGYLVAAVALAVVLWHFRRQLGRGPLAGALFFVVTLSPVLGFVDYGYMQHAFVAARFQYLAGIGGMAVVIGGTAQGMCRLPALWHKGARVVAAMVIGVLGMLTWQHQEVWLNEESFWRHVIASNPTAAIAYSKLGGELQRQGRDPEALEVYLVGAAECPSSLVLHVNAAIFLMEQGMEQEHCEDAAHWLRHILKYHPDSAAAHLNLGYALYCLRLPSEAERHLRRSIALDPSVAAAHLNLGNALYTLRRYQEAVQSFDRALSIDPSHKRARANRAAALEAIQQQPAEPATVGRYRGQEADGQAESLLRRIPR